MDLEVEPAGSDTSTCACCDDESRTVWGFLHEGESTLATYYAHWTLGGVATHGANFDFVVGRWGEGTTPDDRVAVSLALRVIEGQPQFMVIDANERRIASSELMGRALARAEVIGTDLAAEAFRFVDAVWLCDERIEELTAAG